MKIINIHWLSKSSKEAELEISDGVYSIKVFSQPCEYQVNQIVTENLRPLDAESLRRSEHRESKIVKLNNSHFSYVIVGVVNDFDRAVISVGEIRFELDIPLPAWINEGELIEFESSRIDLW